MAESNGNSVLQKSYCCCVAIKAAAKLEILPHNERSIKAMAREKEIIEKDCKVDGRQFFEMK